MIVQAAKGRDLLARIVPFALIVLAALGAAESGNACSCRWPPGPRESMIDADAVFLGEVVAKRMNDHDEWTMFDGQTEVDLDIKTAWKGVASGRITVRTSSGGASCGFPFEGGSSYLVYASRNRQGRLTTHLCSRSMPWWLAFYDVLALGEPIVADPGNVGARVLILQLRSWSSAQQINACNSLALCPRSAAVSVPALARLAERTRDRDVRRSALSALGMLGPAASAGVGAIAGCLADPDPSVGLDAARALERLGPTAAAATPQLVTALTDTSATAALLREREHLPGDATDDARDIEEKLWLARRLREQVVQSLGAIGPAAGRSAIDALLREMQGDHPSAESAAALRSMGAGSEAASALLAHLETDGLTPALAPWSTSTLAALGALGPDAAPGVSKLTALLRHEDPRTRRAAAEVLARIGPAAAPAVPALIEALDQVDIDHLAVIDALASIGSLEGAATLARSARILDDPYDSFEGPHAVSLRARRGLEAMGLDPDAVEPASGVPHGRDDSRATAEQARLAAMIDPAVLARVPRLPFISAFDHLGSGYCGHVVGHPSGLVGADFCDGGGVALASITRGASLAAFQSPDAASRSRRESAFFGADVAVMGTTILVAAPSFSGAAIACGAVYVFSEDGHLVRRVDNPFPAYRTRFGDSRAAGPDFFVTVVGPRTDAPRGALLVLDGSGKLRRSIEQVPDGARLSEAALAVVGDRIACGELCVLGDQRPGEVLIIDSNSGDVLHVIRGPRPADDDLFGSAVAGFGDDRILVGEAGAVHVVDLETGAITATARDPEPSDDARDFPAALVALDGERFAVSATGPDRLRVYIFDARGALAAVAEIPASSASSLDRDVGRTLALVQDRLIVGVRGMSAAMVDPSASRKLQPTSNPSAGCFLVFSVAP